jgi:hypothetical protein
VNLWHLHAAMSFGLALLQCVEPAHVWRMLAWLLIAALSTVSAELRRATDKAP